MIWFSFPLDFVSQEVQDFKIVTVMVFRILLFFLRFGFFRFFCDLDLLVFRISCRCLTVQILKGFESPHNLFDKGVVFFDFWKFLSCDNLSAVECIDRSPYLVSK